MGELGVGLFELANESQVAARDPEARAEANARLRRLAVDTGVPVTFGVLGAADPQIWRDQLDLLDETAAEGGRMFAQTHCRGVSVLLSFKTRLPFDRLPEWAELRALPLDAQAELLAPSARCASAWSARPTRATTAGPSAPRPASRATTGSTCSSAPTAATRRWPSWPSRPAAIRSRS